MRRSRVFVCGVAAGPLLGLSGCAFQLSDWDPPILSTTVVTDTSETFDDTTSGTSTSGDAPSRQTFGDMTSGQDTSSSGTVDPCDNDQLDEGETAVDCGGDECQPCGLGLPCAESTDCQSGVCAEICLAAGCTNDEMDGDETDQDCGGTCQPCADSARCLVDTDCASGVCDDEICQAATCDDGVKNGDEADEDCGTLECGLCANGAACTLDEQCALGACKQSLCADPQCNDNRKNGDETDTDCGGSCPPCGTDDVCLDADDCESQVCLMTSSNSGRCAEPACDDGEKNGNESHVDCGGFCDPCADGDPCTAASDCQSNVCDAPTLLCLAPSCDDDVRNGDEVGIDCGGSGDCSGCPDGTPCGSHSDCASNSCDETCQAPSCDDERKNQSEADVDCGGPCDECGFGRMCDEDADCLSNDCSTTCQRGVVGAECASGSDCLSGSCDDEACVAGFRGAECVTGADCQSGYCKSDNTCGSGGLNTPCLQNTDCASNLCNTTCSASRISIRSDSGTETAVVKQNMQVQANQADPARAWKDVAFLYFFSIVPDEERVNFQARSYQGPDFATKDNRFLAINGQGNDWVMIWRALSTNSSNIPSASVTPIELQLNNSDWSNFNQTNDHSYRSGGFAENTKIVVCQRIDGRWAHIQGSPPATIPDPCRFVVDTCAGTTATCDVLERVD